MAEELESAPKPRFAITRLDRVLVGLRSAFVLASVIDILRVPGAGYAGGLFVIFFTASLHLLLLYAMVRGKRWAFGLAGLELFTMFWLFGLVLFWLREGAFASFASLTFLLYFLGARAYCVAFGIYSAARFFGTLGPRRRSPAGILSEAPPWPTPLPPRLS